MNVRLIRFRSSAYPIGSHDVVLRRNIGIWSLGGFDMAFCGRHAGEDQNLGRRLARRLDGCERVFIHEPPFAWHPTGKLPWAKAGYTNLYSAAHRLFRTRRGGIEVETCNVCPHFRVLEVDLYRDDVRMRYDPAQVEVTLRRTVD
jgi:hypothetical protein